VSRRANTALAVYDGQDRTGMVLERGSRGFEAFDGARRSLRLFPSQREAADAINPVAPSRSTSRRARSIMHARRRTNPAL
jgi:hypothetical protein